MPRLPVPLRFRFTEGKGKERKGKGRGKHRAVGMAMDTVPYRTVFASHLPRQNPIPPIPPTPANHRTMGAVLSGSWNQSPLLPVVATRPGVTDPRTKSQIKPSCERRHGPATFYFYLRLTLTQAKIPIPTRARSSGTVSTAIPVSQNAVAH
ncbi:hypothetical protein C8R46DRAFT_295651 [Mycena filopes]|nr:hypothetical protein C8R46DRAFT_295651 [Mycena filopes]